MAQTGSIGAGGCSTQLTASAGLFPQGMRRAPHHYAAALHVSAHHMAGGQALQRRILGSGCAASSRAAGEQLKHAHCCLPPEHAASVIQAFQLGFQLLCKAHCNADRIQGAGAVISDPVI